MFHHFLTMNTVFCWANTLWLYFPVLIDFSFPSSYLFASGFSCLLRFIEDRLCVSISCFPCLAWFSGTEWYGTWKKSCVLWHYEIGSDLPVFKTRFRRHISMRPSLITCTWASTFLNSWHHFIALVLLSNTLCLILSCYRMYLLLVGNRSFLKIGLSFICL